MKTALAVSTLVFRPSYRGIVRRRWLRQSPGVTLLAMELHACGASNMKRLYSTSFIGIVALVLLSACAPTRTTKSAGEQVDDSAITARVKTALARDLGAGDSIRTDVETFRGTVQLNGFVD